MPSSHPSLGLSVFFLSFCVYCDSGDTPAFHMHMNMQLRLNGTLSSRRSSTTTTRSVPLARQARATMDGRAARPPRPTDDSSDDYSILRQDSLGTCFRVLNCDGAGFLDLHCGLFRVRHGSVRLPSELPRPGRGRLASTKLPRASPNHCESEGHGWVGWCH